VIIHASGVAAPGVRTQAAPCHDSQKTVLQHVGGVGAGRARIFRISGNTSGE
jgi:hypothetical protein